MSRAIGMFDSGVGGISVLRDAVRMLPHERFIFYGDNQNAPYGVKTQCEILNCTQRAIQTLLERNVKALVLAWNRRSSRRIFCAMAGRFSCWPHLRHSIWRSFAI